MMKYLLNLKLYYNFIFLFILISNIKGKENLNEIQFYKNKPSEKGIILTQYINSTDIEMEFEAKKEKYLFHFLSIDCDINIEAENKEIKGGKGKIEVIKLSYYNYGAFTSIIEQNVNFKIKLLNKDYNKNRNFPLIINSIKIDEDEPVLIIKENEPAFLYFNNDFKKIRLKYDFEKTNIDHPIIISFFIKEKIRFKIEIKDGENKIINRNINYKENIIIKPELSKANYTILIYPDEEIINSTMIVKIIQSNSSPFYLKRDQLNFGFIPIKVDYYYYYMEVVKGEEGEIMLFNQRQDGILISKIIEKKNNITPKIDDFPKYNEIDMLTNNEYLKFDIYNQKVSFFSSHTEICDEGCFLLITYYSKISNSLEINGNEFSILSRIWDEEEFSSQIINIPLNEYIFGSFDGQTVNIHYYSVFIPYETDNIYIEVHGKSILGFAKEGIVKINTYKMTNNTKQIIENYEEEKTIIKLNKKDINLNLLKGKYISFTFEIKGAYYYSDYYFRILQQNYENNYIIYPLDINKENFCETKNKKCYFLLKNEYNDLLNNCLIFCFGGNVSYKMFNIKDIDYYSSNMLIDDNLNNIKKVENSTGHLRFNLENNEQYVLIEIESNSAEEKNLIIVSNFYNEADSLLFNIYSYQLYYLSKNNQKFHLYHNHSNDNQYRILINNAEGEGYICFNETCNSNNIYIHLTEQRIYSFSIENKTDLFFYTENNLTFNIKVIHQFLFKEIKELNYQDNNKAVNEKFPFLYFIKDIKYNGININFNLEFDDSDINSDDLVIRGYALDYDCINSYDNKNDLALSIIDNNNEIKGNFDSFTNSGSIELSKELINKNYNEISNYVEDLYFVILIDKTIPYDLKNTNNNNTIYVFSKDENKILLPINRYIRNSFNLLENKTTFIQKYFFEKENIISDKFVLEFSSNYENIELKFNNFTNFSTKTIGGFKQYILSINSNSPNDYYFYVEIKSTNEQNLENYLKEVNIIIKYYNEEKNVDIGNICNKNLELEKVNKTDKISNYNLIIKNKDKTSNFPKDMNFIYYLRLIKKDNILKNEQLNTIALISSNLSYINKINIIEPIKEFSFNLNNLKNNEKYIASIFIKIENKVEEEEKYCSMIYEILEIKDYDIKLNIFIIIIAIVAFIIIVISFILIFFKMKNKNRSLQDKVNAISFSDGISEDLTINKDSIKDNEDYENSFI